MDTCTCVGAYISLSTSSAGSSTTAENEPDKASTSSAGSSTTPDNIIAESPKSSSNVQKTMHSPSSTKLIKAVQEILAPPADEITKKAVENKKYNYRMNKSKAQILTADDAIEVLKIKELNKNKKGNKKTSKKNNENKNKITSYFKGHKQSISQGNITEKLKLFWKNISPPTKEKEVVGKWYAAIFKDNKGKQNLCIGRALRRFLEEEDGKISHLEIDCLKPHVGTSNIMDEYPEHQNDVYMFKASDVFFGPVIMEPYLKRKWKVGNLDQITNYYDKITGIDRMSLYDNF